MPSQKQVLVTRKRCLLFILLLTIPIIFISIRELEFHPYDLTSTEVLPLPVIELPPSLRKLKQKSIHTNITLNTSIHTYNITIPTNQNITHALNNISLNNSSLLTINTLHNISKHSFKPYRTLQHKLIAFKRYLNGHGKIIIIHQRKSGGTTLENWFTEINKNLAQKWNSKHPPSNQWNSTVEVREAYHFFHKILENNLTWSFSTDPYSIYITSIRHPINRILSQYEFEWRWGCQRCDYAHNLERYKYSNMSDWTFMSRSGKLSDKYVNLKQYKIKKYAAIDFNDWLHRLIIFEIHNNKLGTSQHSMQSVRSMYINNYFLWISCCPKRWCNIQRDFIAGYNNSNKVIKCFNKAINILASFDILLITEWMNDLRSQVYVNQLFFQNKSHIENQKNYIGIDKVNKPYPHHVKNRGKNYMISPKNEEILYKLNSWDLKLYQYAKTIVFKRIQMVYKHVFDQDGDENFNELLYDKNIKEILDVDEDVNHVFSPYKELMY